MGNHEKSNQEILDKCTRSALEGKGGNYVGIKEEKARAAINYSKLLAIRNAIVLVKTRDSIMEWEVYDGHVTACPATLHIGIKNMKTVVLCVGDEDKEESYAKLKKQRTFSQKYCQSVR